MQASLLRLLSVPFQILASILAVGAGFIYQLFVGTNNRLTGISLMERFDQFPTYQTSQEEYLEIRGRVEAFFNCILAAQEAELQITANDINSLRVIRGETDSKRKSMGKVSEFFEVSESGILERRFVYPFPNRFGFLDRIMLISYIKKDQAWVEIRQIVEKQGKPVDPHGISDGQIPLTQSPLLFLILTADRSIEEKGKFIKVVEKIREISVDNETLCIKV